MRFSIKIFAAVLAYTASVVQCRSPFLAEARSRAVLPTSTLVLTDSQSTRCREAHIDAMLDLRGGAPRRRNNSRTGSLSKSTRDKTVTGKNRVGKSEKKGRGGDLMKMYKDTPVLTRIYSTMVAVVTLLGILLGEETAQGLFALDPMRLVYGMELWRPLTAATYLGKPSLTLLFSAYYLYEYGSTLERVYGVPQFLIFLLTQITLLMSASLLFRMPFFTGPVITSMLHVLSRMLPHQKVAWLIFKIPYWTLPYGLMFADIVRAESAVSAALPHILGILTGHFYHFHKNVWPKMDRGEDWLSAPDFLVRRLDVDARNAEVKSSINKALKKRSRGRGRKLGK